MDSSDILNMQSLYMDLIHSEISSTLGLVPGSNTLQFEPRPTKTDTLPSCRDETTAQNQPAWYDMFPNNPVRLYIGTYGDCYVYACPDGTVHKEVFRDGKLRKTGKVMSVRQPLSQLFKDIPAPFCWSSGIESSLHTPLATGVLALVQLYCQQWARRTGIVEAELPAPKFDALVAVFRTLQRVIDSDKTMPKNMRRVQIADNEEDEAEDSEGLVYKENVQDFFVMEDFGIMPMPGE